MNTEQLPAIREMLGELLSALRFDQMAKDVLTESEPARLRRYAKVVAKASPPDKRREICTRLYALNLL